MRGLVPGASSFYGWLARGTVRAIIAEIRGRRPPWRCQVIRSLQMCRLHLRLTGYAMLWTIWSAFIALWKAAVSGGKKRCRAFHVEPMSK